jgi:predicted ATPase
MSAVDQQRSNAGEPRSKLDSLFLSGFKSFDNSGQEINFGDVTVLLGANGAGKSCLISFFKMLNNMSTDNLQAFIGQAGSATTLLHYGPKYTDKIQFRFRFSQGERRSTEYEVHLSHAIPDRLVFTRERITFHDTDRPRPQKYDLEIGGGESKLFGDPKTTSKVLRVTLALVRHYHFHDTSDTAHVKGSPHIDDNRYLKSNAGNLSAFLYALKFSRGQRNHRYYDRIVRHIKAVIPQFKDFDLEPNRSNPNFIRLMWRDVSGHDYLFGPDQLSDGSLRFMALTTLLLQPPHSLPSVIVLDEPELGLHPAAIHDVAHMIKMAAEHSQVILATQSPRLADEFNATDIAILERNESSSRTTIKRFSEEELSGWLDDYTMSELWEKNVLGGVP